VRAAAALHAFKNGTDLLGLRRYLSSGLRRHRSLRAASPWMVVDQYRDRGPVMHGADERHTAGGALQCNIASPLCRRPTRKVSPIIQHSQSTDEREQEALATCIDTKEEVATSANANDAVPQDDLRIHRQFMRAAMHAGTSFAKAIF